VRVLLWMPNGKRVPGGHVVQLERTAEALGDAGVEVIVEFSTDPPSVDVDLVHGFGLDAADIRAWHTRGVPVVLSSIYWDRAYRTADGPRPSARALAGRGVRALQFARASLRGRGALVEACLQLVDDDRRMITAFEAADLLLPNAEGEAASVRADLGVSTPITPVPNGVDPSRFAGPTVPFKDRGYVLFVGRIEPHKNQLGLIRALEDQGMPLTIAGPDHPDHRHYAERCRSAGAGWVTITGRVTDEELRGLYRGARVHALPTWFETTGLVSLEAALSGCSVVSTSRGHAREYFEDLAWYCDPADPDSIRSAVRRAWATPPSPDLKRRVLARNSGPHAAAAPAAAYRALLGDSVAPLN